ncbi:MAG TPA: HAD family phosphatase [Patescibacteria group bacterium]|nr:HAD family phosphatase [Patescibacteria group bacterium]
MYRVIIFDFFDVIHIDPLAAMLRARSRQREGLVLKASEALDEGKIGTDEFFGRLAVAFNESVEALKKECMAYTAVNDELIPLIEDLARHYKVGLLSNAGQDYLRGLLHDHDLQRLFDHVVISSEVGMAKPDPAIFEHTLAKLGAKAEESIFIDDNPMHVDAASILGMQGLVYTDVRTLRTSLQTLGITMAPTN